MKKSFVRGACVLVVAAAFGTAGATPSVTAGHESISVADPAASSLDIRADRALRAAVTFQRDAELASLADGNRKCKFTSSRNPLRPRTNECRLA